MADIPLTPQERAKAKLIRAEQAARAFNLRGYTQTLKEQQAYDRARRSQAESGNSVILSPDDVKGDYDTARTLFTTLGGVKRPVTMQDLAAFKKNVDTLQKTIKEKYKGGFTPQQIIDMSLDIDRERANKQIHYAQIYKHDADKGIYHFVTNSSKDSPDPRHNVTVQFSNWGASLASPKPALDMAKKYLAKGHVKFDCDCGRHTFWYRYLATVGNYFVGRRETGYPKERNSGLVGVACKHVLRVMTVIMQHTTTTTLARHLQDARNNVQTKSQRMTPEQMREELREQERRNGQKRQQVRPSEQKAYKKAVASAKARPTARQKELAELIKRMNNLSFSEREKVRAATKAQMDSAKTLLELNVITKANYNKDLSRHKATIEALDNVAKSANGVNV